MSKRSNDTPAGGPHEPASAPPETPPRDALPPALEVPPIVRDEEATRPYTPRRRPAPAEPDFSTQHTPLVAPADPPVLTKPESPAARAVRVEDAIDTAAPRADERENTAEWRFDTVLEEQPTDGEDSHVIGGRYRILEGVAMGGMGAVFKVRHLTLGKEFALKIIHQALSDDSQMLKFFTREAQVLSKLDHPGIVRITDFGHDERFGAYLVMEYLVGETLHARLARERRLATGPALTVGLQIAEALHHMHSGEIIHCDIKPENVFLVRQPDRGRQRIQAKIIDFGLSKNMAKGARLNVTEIGGTPIYAAPEQLEGRSPQPSMDIYAMGELLYHMLSGAPPFYGATTEVCSLKMTGTAPPITERCDKPVDEHLAALIMKSLERLPEIRQTSMAQMVFELRTVMDMLGVGAVRRRQKRETASVPLPPLVSPPETAACCDTCPVPVFFTDPQATLTATNVACARFLKERLEDLKGRRLGGTRLGNVFPGIDDELREVCQSGAPRQRLVTFPARGDQSTTLLVWMVPRQRDDGTDPSIWGLIVPLDCGLL